MKIYAQELKDCSIFCLQVFTKLQNVGLGSKSDFQIFASHDISHPLASRIRSGGHSLKEFKKSNY